MKTIVAIWHSGSKGKSSVLREVAMQLNRNYPPPKAAKTEEPTIPPKGDFRVAFKINGKIIGITTQGDPKTGLEQRLDDLIKEYNCDIVLCSCRTRGETPQAVDKVATQHGFQTVWNSTYQITGEDNQEIVNRLQGKQLIELLLELKLL